MPKRGGPRLHVGFRYLTENDGKSLKSFEQKGVTRFHFDQMSGKSIEKLMLAVGMVEGKS